MTQGLDIALMEWWSQTPSLSSLVAMHRIAMEEGDDEQADADDEDGDGYRDDEVAFDIETDVLVNTNSGTTWRSTVDVNIMSQEYDRIRDVQQAVIAAWHNSTFAGTGCSVTYCRAVPSSIERDSNVWIGTVALTINHTTV